MKKELKEFIKDFEYDESKKINISDEERKRYIEEISEKIRIELEKNEIKRIKSWELARKLIVD